MQFPPPSIPPIYIVMDGVWWVQWDFWISFFTMILAVGTIWLAVEARNSRLENRTTMANIEKHAAESAAAATASAKATQALAEIGQRPWVSLKELAVLEALTLEQPKLMLKATFHNSGKTPAQNARATFHYLAISGVFPEKPGYHENHVPLAAPMVIPADQPRSAHMAFPIPSQDLEGFVEGRLKFYIYIRITYRDAFDHEHRTLWCAECWGRGESVPRFRAQQNGIGFTSSGRTARS